MQIQKTNNQRPVAPKQPNFKGLFIIEDPKVLSCAKGYSEDMFIKLQRISGDYARCLGTDKVTIKSLPENDISVFAQLKKLGLNFKAIIGQD